MNERTRGLSPNVLLAMMAASALVTAKALLPIEGPPHGDFPLFLYPWMDAVRERGLASIAGDFSAYTPPYVYLLYLASLIEPAVGTLAAVKLVNVPFVILCVWGIGALVREVTGDDTRAMVASAAMCVCPSLLINAFAYGQCDAIFTSFLIWFAYFAMRGRPVAACVMFGLAFAFKQQALFLAPLLLTLLIWRRLKLWQLLLIPATYVVMMVPAAIAGRPWGELLTIYVRQADVMHDLSLNAPNPWWFLRGVIDYRTGVLVGLAAGVAAATVLAWRSVKLPRTAFSILLIATVCAAAMPWVLPKMTARYFFVADLLTIALAFSRPRLWPAAVLIQLGSLLAVLSYFLEAWETTSSAFAPMTLGVGILLFELFACESGEANGRS